MLFSLKCSTVCSRLYRSFFRFHSVPTHPSANNSTSPLDFKSSVHQSLDFSLEKCSSMRELKVLHARIILQGLVSQNITLGKLISFCSVSQVGDLHYAHLVFDHLPQPNKFMFNCLIRGYSTSPHPINAIFLYVQMMRSGFLPNRFTLPFVLKSCASQLAAYSKHGLIRHAREIFDQIPEKNVISWNSMILCYVQDGQCKEALLLFQQMCETTIIPDETTLVLELETDSSSGLYVLLSNIYFEAERWKKAKNVRKLMSGHGFIKCNAVSFVEIDECIL
ncbi:hypothetical protein Csa_006258 [Cucumis sativus]|nr:hypothetical protein Csa_006258 [Cucumis sativus]